MFEPYLSALLAVLSLLLGAILAPVSPPPAPQVSGAVTEADVRLSSGLRLHYVTQGPADGPALLLLHGYTDSSFSYSRVLPLLPPGWRVIAIDQRGHGDSDRSGDRYAIDDFAADAVGVMDALHVPSAVVVGHSMGSFVARRVAERAPDRVTKLVFIGSAPTADTAVVRELAEAVDGLTDPVDALFAREFQESTVARPVPAAFLDRAIAISRAMPASIWRHALAGLIHYTPAGVPRCPVLVIGGESDGVFSGAEQRALAASIPGAEVDIVQGIGHAIHWEDPSRFVDALVRFVARE